MAKAATKQLTFTSFGESDESIQANPSFLTTRPGKTRLSVPHRILRGTFNDLAREIQVFSEEGQMHRCKIDRLPDVAASRVLWKKLVAAQKNQQEICFKAAGGFSPETWFYDIIVLDNKA